MIDVAGLRLQVETDLTDTALQLVLSAVDEELTSNYGAATAAVETTLTMPKRYLFLSRAASSLTSITERDSDGTTTSLDVSALPTADARLAGTRLVERLATGTHPRSAWAQEVVATYVPTDINRRDLAIVQLVKLELEYTGKDNEQIGLDFKMTSADYAAEKAKIIRGLKQWGLV